MEVHSCLLFLIVKSAITSTSSSQFFKHHAPTYKLQLPKDFQENLNQHREGKTDHFHLNESIKLSSGKNSLWAPILLNRFNYKDPQNNKPHEITKRKLILVGKTSLHSSNSSSTLFSGERLEYDKNFASPKREIIPRNTNVRARKNNIDSIHNSPIQPVYLGMDSDLTIEIDDGYVDMETMNDGRHSEHVNPLLYVDSYGWYYKPLGKYKKTSENKFIHGEHSGYNEGVHVETGGSSHFEKGLVHDVKYPKTTNYHSSSLEKTNGRVRMQVFRGPTHNVGYTQWGFYVIQPVEYHSY